MIYAREQPMPMTVVDYINIVSLGVFVIFAGMQVI